VTPLAVTDHHASGILELRWGDGSTTRLPHALLRRHCRCGLCENNRRRSGVEADVPATIRLADIRPVGDHALNLVFDDGHDRGIYPWAYLHELAAGAGLVTHA
jgi:DUF971 family protein